MSLSSIVWFPRCRHTDQNYKILYPPLFYVPDEGDPMEIYVRRLSTEN